MRTIHHGVFHVLRTPPENENGGFSLHRGPQSGPVFSKEDTEVTEERKRKSEIFDKSISLCLQLRVLRDLRGESSKNLRDRSNHQVGRKTHTHLHELKM